MRKILLTALVIFIGFNLSAQEEGDWSIKGSVGLIGGSTVMKADGLDSKTTQKAFSAEASLNAGYFINDNWEIGLEASYGAANTGIASEIFGLAPNVNYYLPIVDDKFYYTPGAELFFGGAESKIEGSDIYGFAFGVGINLIAFEYKPLQWMGLSLSLGEFGYSLTTFSEGGVSITDHDVHFGVDCLAAKVGVKFYL